MASYKISIDLTKTGGILPPFAVEKRNTAKILKSTLENQGATVTVELSKTVDFTPRKKSEKPVEKKSKKGK